VKAAPSSLSVSYQQLSKGRLRVRELPGRNEFTFNMYGGGYGTMDEFKSLIAAMRVKGLGNGFDPGPPAEASRKPLFDELAALRWPVVAYAPFSDFQVAGGRARLFLKDMEAFREMDRAGVSYNIQLGEWGYFFHVLSSDAGWFRDVYGSDFDRYKDLLKPPGSKGYDSPPQNRKEAYEAVRDYFENRSRDLGGRVISMTGHSHYEAYAGEWGANVIGLETGENIRFTQSKVAFARGASRRWGKPWSMQVSPWFAGSVTTSGPLQGGPGNARGLDAGHSLSLYERMWLYGWFAGAAMVTPENSIASFFEEPKAPWTLTEHGRKAQEVFAFMRSHDRGVPYAPLAVVLDHYAGYNGYMDRPWGVFEKTEGDREIDDLFKYQLYPGSGESNDQSLPNPEATYLTPTPYGELCDVLLSNAGPETLSAYPEILLAGDIDFTPDFLFALKKALKSGGRVMLSSAQAKSLGPAVADLRSAGTVIVLPEWTNPKTGRPAAIPDEWLRKLALRREPVRVEGEVQYLVNRARKGWVVMIVNNKGIVKKGHLPARIDPSGAAKVRVTPLIPAQSAREWRTGRSLPLSKSGWTFEMPPGGILFVEITPKPA
jgi:hypothetical protein